MRTQPRVTGRTDFAEAVRRIVSAIPAGEVMTYAAVAAAAGRPRASRAVGNILHRNHDAAVPCHRVVRSDGGLGGFNRGAARKLALLRREGAWPPRTKLVPNRERSRQP